MFLVIMMWSTLDPQTREKWTRGSQESMENFLRGSLSENGGSEAEGWGLLPRR